MTGFHAWLLDDDTQARRTERAMAAALARTGGAVEDGVLMSWPDSPRRPHLRPVENMPRTSALGDAFWGLFFGALTFAAPPSADADPAGADTAGAGIMPAALRQVGVGESLWAALRAGLQVGRAAVVVRCDDAAAVRISAAVDADRVVHLSGPPSDGQRTASRPDERPHLLRWRKEQT